MENLRKIVATIILFFILILLGLNYKNSLPSYGGDANVYTGGQSYYLSGTGLTSSATSIGVTDFSVYKNDGTKYELLTADVAGTSGNVYLTVEPGNSTKQEFVSCTTVTQGNGTSATLSGCSRGLLPFSPYTASTTYAFPHNGGAKIIVSNSPAFYNQFAGKGNDESITGTWTFSDSPILSTECTVASADTEICAKAYIDSTANAGASDANLTTKGIVEIGTQTQNASSTQFGETGAWLAQASRYATDTPNTATRGSVDIWSGVTGYLAQGWLNLTEAFTWTGAHIFQALVTMNGGLTSTATTTISASSVTNNALVLNGVASQAPSSNLLGVLRNDGSGIWSWGGSPRISYAGAGPNPSAEGYASTTLFSIPAGFMTASSTIEINYAGTSLNNGGSGNLFLRTTGGTTLYSFGSACGTIGNGATSYCSGHILVSFYSASSQASSHQGIGSGANGIVAYIQGRGTASVDFSNATNLVLVSQAPNANQSNNITSVSAVANK